MAEEPVEALKTRELLDAAWKAVGQAYAPYSRFRVGAAILTTTGAVYSGCNVENASYGGTMCAERNAIAAAVVAGALAPGGLLAVLVATPTSRAVAPCGICRQVIEEFAAPEARIMLSIEPDKVITTVRHRDLLPHSFGRSDLNTQL